MGTVLITSDDITEILQKKYKEKNLNQSIDELTKLEVDNFIIDQDFLIYLTTFLMRGYYPSKNITIQRMVL